MIIPDTVKEIKDDTFRGCTSLTSVMIPDNVTRIGHFAFNDCGSIKSITIPNSVKSIGISTFEGCKSIKSITIPNNVDYIHDYTFSNCDSLTSITLSDNTINIGWYAFGGCKKLKTKKAIYKAFNLKNGKIYCRGYEFKEGEWSDEIKDISMCNSGYHYCENLFDIFNYYWGEIDKDIVIYECEANGISTTTRSDSKKVCQQIKPVKRLYKEDVIRILNGE